MAEMRRERDAAKRRAQELEDEKAERERQDAEAKGEWEKLANDNAAERDAAKAETARVKAERMVERIANRPKFNPVTDTETGETTSGRFINPDEALALLPKDTDLTDEAVVTEALQTLATARPHLVRAESQHAPPAPDPVKTPSGGPGGTQPGGKPKLTREYLNGLEVPELQKLRRERPEDVAAALRGS